MKILVTGGAGFIGSHVVDRYIHQGYQVIVVDNLATGKLKNLNPQARFYQMDIRSQERGEVFAREKPEVLNHHAAQIDVRRSVQDPLGDATTNILGMLNLLEMAVRHGVRKVVFASSGGAIYGDQPEGAGRVSEANLRALDPQILGSFNIGTGVETPVNDLFKGLLRVTGRTAEEVHGPAKPGEQRRSVLNCAKAHAYLGWKPRISLAEGLQKTAKYYKHLRPQGELYEDKEGKG